MKNSLGRNELFTRSSLEGPDVSAVAAAMAKHEPAIAELVARYPEPRAALIPCLHLLQGEFGWLAPSVLRAVAFRLGLAPAEVHRVASFYTLFRREPCGRFVLQVCCTLSCELKGASAVVAAIADELKIRPGETTADGLFTLEKVECLGWCDRAPLLQVNDRHYDDLLTPDAARELVRRLRRE